ncbi:hypothetical protein [Bradyrhizobium sp.]|jgi:hypothetical protein|uniref:hypothetical protein n=1 Tax=Bradyrhizobium sp. TaxID=376 RepID=UPI002DFC85DE|nr:hypothetical protein [Bradyrhizobium sp.]
MDEILINTDKTGVQHQPGVAGLRGTQFAVVWADHATGDIKGRMIGVNGAPASDAFPVNFPGTPGTKRQSPAILETGAGFVVAWTEQPPGPPSTPAQVKLRTFEADTLSGPESQVSTTEVEKAIRPALARLPDGGFIVVWADKRQEERIRAQRYGFDGTKSGPEFRANTVPGFHWVPMVACLTNGNIVIAWRARVPGPLMIHLQMFDANGPLGAEQTTALHATEAAMTALDSGRFVIAHIRNAGDSEPGFDTTVAQVSVFEANGAFANIRFAATGDNRIRSDWPTLAPLPGGRFMLAWTEANVDNPAAGTNVAARIFSAQGPIGQPVRINTLTGGPRFDLRTAATFGPEGETAFLIWTDESNAGPDTSGRAVEGRAMTISAAGF